MTRKLALNKKHALISKCAFNRKDLDIEGGAIYCERSKVSRSSKNRKTFLLATTALTFLEQG